MIQEDILVQTEDQNLLRDTYSKALLNKNIQGLNEYRARKKLLERTKEEELETKQRLAKLESDMQDIKNLLIEIAALRK